MEPQQDLPPLDPQTKQTIKMRAQPLLSLPLYVYLLSLAHTLSSCTSMEAACGRIGLGQQQSSLGSRLCYVPKQQWKLRIYALWIEILLLLLYWHKLLIYKWYVFESFVFKK